jgi:predicted Zn-ribbon and HTH transcriptional regulator
MSQRESTVLPSRCLKCGFEAAPSDDEWEHVEAPPLGTMTQCPKCGSTDVLSRG